MLVKICGITRLEDAECAVKCGAGALGFVFWPGSPRCVDPERARAIVSAIPTAVMTVGVFVNQTSAEVNLVAETVGLRAIQLHGEESAAYALGMTRPIIKAIALADSTDAAIDAWPAGTLILLDAHDPSRRGGTGRTVDWERAAAVSRRRPIVLAGGLRPENVAEAVATVRPFGIDVSSGVETTPGVKDHDLLRALFSAVEGARPFHPAPDSERPRPRDRRVRDI